MHLHSVAIEEITKVFFSSASSFFRDRERQSFLYRDRSFFGSLTICLARSVFLSVLCRDNLMCGYWNSYVATSTVVS